MNQDIVRVFNALLATRLYGASWFDKRDLTRLSARNSKKKATDLVALYKHYTTPLKTTSYWEVFDLQGVGSAFAFCVAFDFNNIHQNIVATPVLKHRICKMLTRLKSSEVFLRTGAAYQVDQGRRLSYTVSEESLSTPIYSLWRRPVEHSYQIGFIRKFLPDLQIDPKGYPITDDSVIKFTQDINTSEVYATMLANYNEDLKPLIATFNRD